MAQDSRARVRFDADPRPAYAARLIHRPPNSAAADDMGAIGVTGRLAGGSLSLSVTTLGTPWALDTRGAILFLEDTDEAPYRIDRMLTHLRTAGRFEGVRAVVFGHLRRCDSDPPGLLEQAIRDVFRDAAFPVAMGLPVGHGEPNLPLILGRMARLSYEGRAPVASAPAQLQTL
jgi:muramoyltetrapeptide carboxypeptidase